MAAVQRFTDPASVAASEGAKSLQQLLLAAGPEPALRAAAQQSPGWLGSSAGQGRLQSALAALQEITNAPGKSSLLFCAEHGLNLTKVAYQSMQWMSLLLVEQAAVFATIAVELERRFDGEILIDSSKHWAHKDLISCNTTSDSRAQSYNFAHITF